MPPMVLIQGSRGDGSLAAITETIKNGVLEPKQHIYQAMEGSCRARWERLRVATGFGAVQYPLRSPSQYRKTHRPARASFVRSGPLRGLGFRLMRGLRRALEE